LFRASQFDKNNLKEDESITRASFNPQISQITRIPLITLRAMRNL
jgi:hypothetical protein